MLLLVPALAWLQYRWVGQVSEAERERMQRTLRTAAAQFATAFDTELSRAVVGLQVEGSTVRDENWTSYAQRYTTWVERAADRASLRDLAGRRAAAAPAAAVRFRHTHPEREPPPPPLERSGHDLRGRGLDR